MYRSLVIISGALVFVGTAQGICLDAWLWWSGNLLLWVPWAHKNQENLFIAGYYLQDTAQKADWNIPPSSLWKKPTYLSFSSGYYKKSYTNKLGNLEEMDTLLKTYSSKTKSWIENLNIPITSKKIESVIKYLPKTKSRTRWLHWQILPKFNEIL